MTRALVLALVLLCVGACGASQARPVQAERGAGQEGLATWYGGKFNGRKTASGERFDDRKFTAAHRTLPFGTKVRVTNTKNGRTVQVRINDRGPYGGGRRIIDLSKAAARAIDMIGDGVVAVRLEGLWIP